MLTHLVTGEWSESDVKTTIAPSSRRIVPEIESLIDQTWEQAVRQSGKYLFDGPMSRVESWVATEEALSLMLSTTSYKVFFGTNLYNPQLAGQFGREVMANPVGIGPALLSSDGFLMFGRRNASVAYYPNRVHPFAGSLEPADGGNIFAAVRRELKEELKLEARDILLIRCIGVVEDQTLQHPELIFHARTTLTRARIESQLDLAEHGGSVAVAAQRLDIEKAIAGEKDFTPVALGTLLLFGNQVFGSEWFKRHSAGFSPQ